MLGWKYLKLSVKSLEAPMRRKYGDCQREDGNCTLCSLVNYGHDCHNKLISKLEWARRCAGITQKQLSDVSGVNIRQIQRVELGEAQAGNLTAKNLLAIAKALEITVEELI